MTWLDLGDWLIALPSDTEIDPSGMRAHPAFVQPLTSA